MSNLSELLPAGEGAKSASFVASGTLGSGVTVALKSDGTVEAVSLISFSSGSPTVFSTTSGLDGYPSAAYDLGAGKIVQMWRDSASGYLGRASVGTISGSSVSFGTPSTFSGSGRLEQNFNCVYDPTNEKVVLVYPNIDNSAYPTAVVATVSGTSLSFGTPVVIESNAANWSNNQRKPGVTYDTNSNKVVVIYYNNLGQGSAIVGTVSGTTTSWGTRTNFFTSPIGSISATFDSTTNKVIAAHADLGSNLGYVWLGTVSGTSITMGNQTQFLAANARWTGIQYIPSLQKSILVYTDVGNSSIGTAVILDTSTGVSISTPVTYGGEAEYNSVVYDTNINQAIVTFKNATDSNRGNQVQGTISGDTVSFTSAETWSTAYANGVVPVYDPVSFKTYVSFLDGNNGGRGSGIVLSPASSNNTDFIGITDQAIADTATGAVIVQGGVSDKVTSLTTGSDYYVQTDGSLSTTVSSVPAGRALSSTSILLEG